MKKLKKLKNVINFVLCFTMLISIIQIVPQDVYAAKKIKLNKTSMTLYVGEKRSVILSQGKKDLSCFGAKFSSSNKKVATVNKTSGCVKAIKSGTAKITVTYNKKKYVCNITVKDALKDHVNCELIDMPENVDSAQYNKIIKITNDNDVAIKANVSIKQYDKDGFYVGENTNYYTVNKNSYIIALVECNSGRLIDLNNPIQYDDYFKAFLNSVSKTDSIDIEYNISDPYIDNNGVYRDIVFSSPTVKSAHYSILCYNSNDKLTRMVNGYVYIPANEKVKKKDGYNLNFKDKYDIQRVKIFLY